MHINEEAIATLFTRTGIGKRAQILLAEHDLTKIDDDVRAEVNELAQYVDGQNVLAAVSLIALSQIELPEPEAEPEPEETPAEEATDEWGESLANTVEDPARGLRFSIDDEVRVIDEASDAFERTGTVDRIEQSGGRQRLLVELPDENNSSTGDFAAFTAEQLDLVQVPGGADHTTA